jgi:hypothetical protein
MEIEGDSSLITPLIISLQWQGKGWRTCWRCDVCGKQYEGYMTSGDADMK